MRETQIETEDLLGGECTNENVEENRPHSPGADECVKVESKASREVWGGVWRLRKGNGVKTYRRKSAS